MRTLKTEKDLADAYNDWIQYKLEGGGKEHIRFGQYVFNEYNYEYGNSYNSRNNAYGILFEGLTGVSDESE